MIRVIRFLCALVILLAAPFARADGTASFVESGIVLDSAGQGRATLRNSGDKPLHVVTIYARSNERDPRVPGTLTATFEGSSTKADLAPGETRPIVLKWDRTGARMVQLFGHVVVETSDAAAPQRAIGVTAQPPSALAFVTQHVALWLILLPLLGALALVPLRMSRRFDDRLARFVALGAVALQGAFGVWALRNFDSLAARGDGNDGLQMIERARLFGPIEWYVGFDGVSLPLVLLVIGLGVVGVIASFPLERHHEQFFGAFLCALSAATGALLSVDAMLMIAFLVVFAVAAVALGGAGRGSMHMLLMHFIAIAALIVVVMALRRASDATFLVDGARGQTFAIPELARGEWLERTQSGLRLFGRPFVQTTFIVLFIAGAIFLSAAPLHGALGGYLAEAPTGAGLLVSGAGAAVGATIFLRLGVTIVPEGARWAAPALAGLGAASIVWAALAALGEVDLRRAAGHVGVAHAGVIVLAVSGGTTQGLAGAIGHTIARALVVSMLLLVAGALHDRVGVSETARFGGLAREMPRFGILATIAFLASFALPGTLPFASAMLALSGSLPAHRVATAIAAAGLAVLAIAQLLVHRRVLLGELDERWRKTPELEPFGGKFPDIEQRELGLLVALAIVVCVLGLTPRWLVELSRGTVGDLDARVNVDRVG